MDCSSCEDLRELAPEFVIKGLTDKVRDNLTNNKGYGGTTTNCNEVDLANECLIGRMPNALAAYDDCDWKSWAADFAGNVYQMLGSLIAWNCGAYRPTFVRYVASASDNDTGTSVAYVNYTDFGRNQIDSTQAGGTFINGGGLDWDVYMDAVANKQPVPGYNTNGTYEPFADGSKVADHDYAVFFDVCLIVEHFSHFTGKLTPYASNLANGVRPSNITSLVTVHSLHPAFYFNTEDSTFVNEMSYSMSGMVLVRKGEHLKFLLNASSWVGAENSRVALHNMKTLWIPVTARGDSPD